jgi:hypothetical protein
VNDQRTRSLYLSVASGTASIPDSMIGMAPCHKSQNESVFETGAVFRTFGDGKPSCGALATQSSISHPWESPSRMRPVFGCLAVPQAHGAGSSRTSPWAVGISAGGPHLRTVRLKFLVDLYGDTF